ncbi:MAG: hypothetical protein HOA61_00550, partial [Bacteroidetes bacterium]|nr:hypothetical protein [Bacteroidota bacterium]
MKNAIFYLAAMFFFNISFAQDTANWESTYGPRFRHVKAVKVLSNNDLIGVGGNEQNDAISSIVYSSNPKSEWVFKMDSMNAILQDVDFPTDQIGYAVGWDGNVFKSIDKGQNWTAVSISGNAGTRDFNGCHFINENIGIIVGGNESKDSIQTILKTIDGGANWSVISDNLGYWLTAVHFANSSNGYAVGPGGTILKTTDGGENWTALSLSGNLANRVYSDIYVFDATTSIAIGGWYDNDSIQTIIKTTDGGANWSAIQDNLGSMLFGLDFYSATDGYAVGDDGTILFTDDAGENWTAVVLDGEETAELRDVHFRNEYIGLVGGLYGKLIWYEGETPPDPDKAIAKLNSPVSIPTATSAFIS